MNQDKTVELLSLLNRCYHIYIINFNKYCSFLIVGPSSVHILNKNISVTTLIEGNPRRFLCQTASSNPRPIVVWKINGQVLPPDVEPLEEPGEFSGTTIQLSKTLGLDKSLRHYHKKILSCEARNPETNHTVIDSTELNIIC